MNKQKVNTELSSYIKPIDSEAFPSYTREDHDTATNYLCDIFRLWYRQNYEGILLAEQDMRKEIALLMSDVMSSIRRVQ